MQTALLSDIHDNVWKLSAALDAVRDTTDVMLCCGDLCSPFIVHQIGRGYPRPVYVVFGNNDGDQFRITAAAAKYPHLQIHGELFAGEFEGRKFAMNQFDAIARPLAASGMYDVVCFGHNHTHEIGRWGRRWPSIQARSWELHFALTARAGTRLRPTWCTTQAPVKWRASRSRVRCA